MLKSNVCQMQAQSAFGRDPPTILRYTLNRVADNSLATKLLGWEPQIKFMDGLRITIDWYYSTKDRSQIEAILNRMLTER